MHIRMHEADLKEAFLEQQYPHDFRTTDGQVVERKHQVQLGLGNTQYHEWYFEGVHIGYGNMHFRRTMLVEVESDMETIEMHFALQGQNWTQVKSLPQIKFGAQQHNIFYANGFEGEICWAGQQAFTLFEINLSPQFFKRYLPRDQPYFEAFRREIKQQQWSALSKKPLSITPAMLVLIHEIIHCPRQGVFKKLFLEAKVLELLLLQMEQMEQLHQPTVRKPPRAKEMEKIAAVRELLEKNLTQAYTLSTLARAVGTNEHTLKRGFKAAYGMPVFTYWRSLRMQQARKMLAQEGCTVKEVAHHLGYAEPHHFTTAFKRHFGTLPSQWKAS